MFPFEYETPTVFYLVLYGATLVLHVVPMNYVLAGSTYLAAVGIWELVRGPQEAQRPLVEKLRDWMPFALGVAITAAVAPLLFLQILYQRPFYTANLLLFHRWMSILPVLIVAFYLLYLQKSKTWLTFRAATRAAVSTGILACFAFVAWSWAENHLLSLRDAKTWSDVYVSQAWFYHDPELIPRLTVWYVGAFPTLAMILGWQLQIDKLDSKELATIDATSDEPSKPGKTLAVMALCGLAASCIAGATYLASLEPSVRETLLSGRTAPYVVAASVGLVLQGYAWIATLRACTLALSRLVVAATGSVVAVAAATVLREVRRAASIDLSKVAGKHAEASEIGGFGVFLVFFVVNAALIVAIIAIVRRRLRQDA